MKVMILVALVVIGAPSQAGGAIGSPQVKVVRGGQAAGLIQVHSPQTLTVPMAWVTGGAGVGDFNNDSYADLFVTQGGSAPDRLFINQGDGTFVDEAAAWGLTDIHCGNGVAVGDVNNDGWLDMYVTSYGLPKMPAQTGKNRLYLNNAGTSFTEVGVAAGVNEASPTSTLVYGAAFGDYDLDGFLDLFVATWVPGHNGNRLFHNNGDGTFTDVTVTAMGPSSLDDTHGFQPAFVDMDGDLYPELLIAADFETSHYFRNNGDGTFTDITITSGTGLDDNGMGQTVGDFNNDLLLDWYVTSIHFDNPQPEDTIGNMLYTSGGGHSFAEESVINGCNDGGWGWGVVALDLDQDGWLDIVEVNGRETNPPGDWTEEPAKLYHNQGDGTFIETATTAGMIYEYSGRAICYLDGENDGDLDLVLITNNGPLEYYRNESVNPGNWLQVTLDTSNNPRLAPNGFGTRATITADGKSYVRYLNGSPSFLGTSQLILHFGLDDAMVIEQLELMWTNGVTTQLTDIAANQRITVQAPAPSDVNGDGVTNVDDLIAVILAWGQSSGPTDVNGDGAINVDDLIAIILGWTA